MTGKTNKILNINELGFWRSNLGLLPVPLFKESQAHEKYIMLNGSYGNFCLDFSNPNGDERVSAWSSNVDHYINIFDDKVSVQRWDKFYPEKYSVSSVESKIHNFYDFLRKDKAENNLNVISFSLNVFRQLRTALRDNNGNETVNAFLFLLAYHAGNYSKIKDVDLKKWALNKSSFEAVNRIRGGDWDTLTETMKLGQSTIGLHPNTNLILRHASGSLFQEAHFEMSYPVQYQMTFEGFLQRDTPAGRKITSSSHYTPTSIVRTIVEDVLSKYKELPKKIKVFDPACGSGEFLREIIRQLTIANYKGEIDLLGWDISNTAIDMANFVLAFEKMQTSIKVNFELTTCDALVQNRKWPEDVDIIFMNPPFISWELLKKEEKAKVQDALQSVFEKKPNMASAFFWKAALSLKKNGYLGLILPSSILEGDSNVKLRKELEGILSVSLLGKLGSLNIFSDALVDASIFVAKKGKEEETPINLWCDYNIESSSTALRNLRIIKAKKSRQPVFDSSYSIFYNKLLGKSDRWIPVSYKSWQVLESVKDCPKVKELFEVKQGIRTGMNSAFLIEKSYYLNKLKKEERLFFRAAVTNESISSGKLTDDVYIFYPHGESLPVINNAKDLVKHVPTFYKDYLQPNYSQLKNRARKGEDNWWKLSEHRAWQVHKSPKLVSKEFGKAGAWAFDKKGNYAVERGHGWIPKDMDSWLLNEEIGYAYVAVFSMDIVNELLNAVSKQIGGGQWYLASKFVDEMPIPNLFNKRFDKSLLSELSNMGRLLSKGEDIDQSHLNRLAKNTFGTSK